MKTRSTSKVIGQGHKLRKRDFGYHFTVLQVGDVFIVKGQNGSKSKVTGVNVKCHIGQNHGKADDIGRWALLHFLTIVGQVTNC